MPEASKAQRYFRVLHVLIFYKYLVYRLLCSFGEN